MLCLTETSNYFFIFLIFCLFSTFYRRYRYNMLAELSIRSYLNFIHKFLISLWPRCGLKKLRNWGCGITRFVACCVIQTMITPWLDVSLRNTNWVAHWLQLQNDVWSTLRKFRNFSKRKEHIINDKWTVEKESVPAICFT